MHNVRIPEEMDFAELIEKFEGDILYDAHGYIARFGRSLHQKELVRRGRDALPAIVAHLKANPPGSFMDLDTAWGHLLSGIGIEIDPNGSESLMFKDTPKWIAWAEQMIHLETTGSSASCA